MVVSCCFLYVVFVLFSIDVNCVYSKNIGELNGKNEGNLPAQSDN